MANVAIIPYCEHKGEDESVHVHTLTISHTGINNVYELIIRDNAMHTNSRAISYFEDKTGCVQCRLNSTVLLTVNKRSIYLPVSQLVPVYPGAHEQLYELT